MKWWNTRSRDLHDPDTGELLANPSKESKGLDALGREVPDPTPIAPPVGYFKQPSMVEYIRNLVRSEKLRQEAEEAGAETFEEADDFDVGDDYDPASPFEERFWGDTPPGSPPPAPPADDHQEEQPAPKPAKKGGNPPPEPDSE